MESELVMLSFIFVSLLAAIVLTAIIGVVVFLVTAIGGAVVFLIQLTWPLFLIVLAIILVIEIIGIIMG